MMLLLVLLNLLIHSEIPGVVFPGLEVEDWACPACTTVNPLTELQCSVCETKNPNPPKPKPKEKPATAAAATGSAPKAGKAGKGKAGKAAKAGKDKAAPTEVFNRAGVAMKLGMGFGTSAYYCGRYLGAAVIPGSG